jgi:translocator protein
MRTWTKGIGLFAWFIITFTAAAIGSIASMDAQSFYSSLVQPAWAPGPSVFGPVWTALYTLMAISAWLVWCEQGLVKTRSAFALFAVQLVLNAAWSWIFFVWQQGFLAFLDTIILLIFITLTAISFWRIRPLSALLLVPYFLWVCFAAWLNYVLWMLNPQVLGSL